MNSEEQVRSALKALAEHDRSLESSTPAGTIFAQTRIARPRTDKGWLWVAGSAVAAAMALFAWTQRPTPEPKPIPIVVVDEPTSEQQVEQIAIAESPRPRSVRSVKRVVRQSQEPQQEQEIVTEFFPLMDAPPPFERGQLVRVVVPAATMRTVGLPIAPERWNDRVQADVLVGEEGMARAIRFVSFTQ